MGSKGVVGVAADFAPIPTSDLARSWSLLPSAVQEKTLLSGGALPAPPASCSILTHAPRETGPALKQDRVQRRGSVDTEIVISELVFTPVEKIGK